MSRDESAVDAVRRVLDKEFGVKPTIAQTMRLIEAVRDALPPHPDATIASLRAILRSLTPQVGLEQWAVRSAREIVRLMSNVPTDSEHIWCTIEGNLTGMLLRVATGRDLDSTSPLTAS